MVINTKIPLYLCMVISSQVMKPLLLLLLLFLFFFVFYATSKTFKIFCLYSHGQLTFMKSLIILIAAKFQYVIPSLRTLAVTDTISWSWGRPHRNCVLSHKDFEARTLQLMWTLSSAPTWEISAESSSVECYYYHYCCCCRRWWYLLLGLFVLWPSISSLLQSATSVITKCDSLFCCKVRWSVITKCESFFITKCDKTQHHPPGTSIGKAKHTN